MIKIYYVVLHVNYFELLILPVDLLVHISYKFVRPVPPMGKQWGVPL